MDFSISQITAKGFHNGRGFYVSDESMIAMCRNNLQVKDHDLKPQSKNCQRIIELRRAGTCTVAVHTRKVKLRTLKILFTLSTIVSHRRGNRGKILTNIGEFCLQKKSTFLHF